MTETAKISAKYLWWLGLISLLCLGFAVWFFYDGLITYPARRTERALTYQRLEEEGRLREWTKIATERGWSPETPAKPKTELEIRFQLVLGALAAIPGLLWLFFFLRARRRWIELNETGLRTSWGQQLEFDQIVTLDKKKWKAKGIVKIRYQQDGRKRTLVLDDWKYDPKPIEAILREVESRIEPGQITGGPPLPPLDEETEPADPPPDEEPT